MSSFSRGHSIQMMIIFFTTALFIRTSYSACDPYCTNGCYNNGDGKCDGSCTTNYRFNDTTKGCVPCSANCGTGCQLRGDYSCDECKFGFGLDYVGTPRTCKPCDPNCKVSCVNSGSYKCDGYCNDGYNLNIYTKKCDPAGGGPGPVTTTTSTTRTTTTTTRPPPGPPGPVTQPAQCSAHCSGGCSGRGAGSCDICDPGFGLNNAAKPVCGACDTHCTNGCLQKGSDRCDGSCMSGYTYDANTGICVSSVNPPGPPGPVTTRTTVKVTVPVGPAGPSGCSSSCLQCSQTVSGSCDVCKSGSSLTSGTIRTCVDCDVNCVSQCSAAGNGKCDSNCKSGFVLDSSKTCQKCDKKCSSGCQTSGAGYCDGNCQPNYGPVGAAGKKTCAICARNCEKGCNTNGGGSCDGCVTGYGLTDSSPRICMLCDTNCVGGCSSNGASKCDGNCRPGYDFDSSTKTCKVSTTNNNPYPAFEKGPADWRRGRSANLDCDPHCIGGCSVTGKGKCDGDCISNYGKTVSKSCRICAENCAGGCKVNGAGACDTCSQGYGKTESQPRTCGVCDNNCAGLCKTSGSGRCDDVCNVDYELIQSVKVCSYIYGGNSANGLNFNLLLIGFTTGLLIVTNILMQA